MIYLDFETRSEVELRGSKSVGTWNYCHHPSTEILMLGWAIDDGPVSVWEPRLGSMPSELLSRIVSPKEKMVAFHSSFERYLLSGKLNIMVPIERFVDPQAYARYLSLPGDLDEVGQILGLPQDLAKDKRGKHLINIFTRPTKRRKKRGEATEFYFRDWHTDPDEWMEFVEYCRQDVVAEREILRREKILQVYPLPPLEQKIWCFDQLVNDRGIPVDPAFVTSALKLASKEKEDTIEANNETTGVENSNSNSQMLPWFQERGYPFDSLEKELVAEALKNAAIHELTPECIAMLKSRQSNSSMAYKKMAAILRQLSPDNRLRGQFIYMGSSRCGRWSGNAVQLHNLAKPNDVFEIEDNVEKARAFIYREDYEALKLAFQSALLVVKYNIRTAFVAGEGNRFNICDLNAIETRVGAWLASCQPLLDVFFQGKDPYVDFATKMTQIPYDRLWADLRSKDPVIKLAAKKHRTLAKPGVLGCIYRMGAKALMEYAESFGLEMTQKQAEEIVRVFRECYQEIKYMWYHLEDAVADVMKEETVRVKRELGPNGCIKIDKFIFTCKKIDRVILRIQLPSGRRLHYMDAYMEDEKMPWLDAQGQEVFRKVLHYAGQDQETKQWTIITSHGGKLFENIVQGIARDILAVKLMKCEESGLPIVLHVHDEGIAETKNDYFEPGFLQMNKIFSEPVDWAPGLPLAADGFESPYYHKQDLTLSEECDTLRTLKECHEERQIRTDFRQLG